MIIWVDADACPKPVKEILFRAVRRTSIKTILVANSYIAIPASPHISLIQVPKGFDVADNYIVQNLKAGDLVITADIPLAAEVVDKKAIGLNPRGELYTENNIRQRLAMRNTMEQLRGSGVQVNGPDSFGQREKQAFANALDRLLAKSV